MQLRRLMVLSLCMLTIGFASAQDNFPDVPEAHWAYKAFARMKAMGIPMERWEGVIFHSGRPASPLDMADSVEFTIASLPKYLEQKAEEVEVPRRRLRERPHSPDKADLLYQIRDTNQEMLLIRSEILPTLHRMIQTFRQELIQLKFDPDAADRQVTQLESKPYWPYRSAPKDERKNHWAHDAVESLFREGLMQGYPSGIFKVRLP